MVTRGNGTVATSALFSATIRPQVGRFSCTTVPETRRTGGGGGGKHTSGSAASDPRPERHSSTDSCPQWMARSHGFDAVCTRARTGPFYPF
ncbi:hypothetical protein ZHAS_00009208 [Anopheles sinensis]|uniref:Uncharacterized protein n=1 Tax=Anopheles sinensis TaxID=74873 RepID=A0A084VUF6_ANOSI|nr:hypothetical protein ZHAS_00009208 [Anopheles sinensis]